MCVVNAISFLSAETYLFKIIVGDIVVATI
jgi:hypothetical protein